MLQLLQDFQGISEEMRFDLLQKAASISLKKAVTEARHTKKMAHIKDCFVELTKATSWSTAVERFPDHAIEEILADKFLGKRKMYNVLFKTILQSATY